MTGNKLVLVIVSVFSLIAISSCKLTTGAATANSGSSDLLLMQKLAEGFSGGGNDNSNSSCCSCGGCCNVCKGGSDTKTCTSYVFVSDDQADPKPLENVAVRVSGSGNTYFTDSNGYVAIDDLNGSYGLTAYKENYVTKSPKAPIILKAQNASCPLISIVMSPSTTPTFKCGSTVFTVKDDVTNSVIAGATVNINGASFSSDASGLVIVSNLLSKKYSYSASQKDYTPIVSGEYDNTDGLCTGKIIWMHTFTPAVLTCNGSLKFRDSKTPSVTIKNFTLTFTNSSNANVPFVKNLDGSVSIADLVNGTYNYSVTATGYNPASGTFGVSNNTCSKIVDLNPVTPTCNGKLTFKIPGTTTVIKDFTLTFTKNADGTSVPFTKNTDGTVSFSSLVAGTYTYTITAAGYENKTGTYTVLTNACSDLSVDLTPVLPPPPAACNATFTFVDDKGAALTGVTFKHGTTTEVVTGNTSTVSSLVSGDHFVYSASKDKYLPLSDTTYTVTSLTNGSCNPVIVTLRPKCSLTITVLDDETKQPIPYTASGAFSVASAYLFVNNGVGTPVPENGQVLLSFVGDGTYTYKATSDGYDDNAGTYVVSSNTCTPLTIYLKPKKCNAEFKFVEATDGATPVYSVNFNISKDAGLNFQLKDTESGIVVPGLKKVSPPYSYTATKTNYDVAKGTYNLDDKYTCPVQIVPLTPTLCDANMTIKRNGVLIGYSKTVSVALNGDVYKDHSTDPLSGLIGMGKILPGSTYKVTYVDSVSNASYNAEGSFNLLPDGTCPATVALNSYGCEPSIINIQDDKGSLVTGESIRVAVDDNNLITLFSTNSSGVFKYTLRNGVYTVSVVDKGSPAIFNDKANVSYTVNSDSCTVNIPLTRKACDATFTFIEEGTNNPVNGVSFKFGSGAAETVVGNTTTRTNLANNNYSYSVSKEGYLPYPNTTYSVSNAECKLETIVLKPYVVVKDDDNCTQYRDLAIDSKGQIVTAGASACSAPNGSIQPGYYMYTARYNPDDLSLDTSFNVNGRVSPSVSASSSWANSLAMQTVNGDEKVVLAGYVSSGDHAFARVSSDGIIDASFGSNGSKVYNFTNYDESTNSIIIQPDNKIMGAGFGLYGGFYSGQYNSNWTRLTEAGSLDTSLSTYGYVVSHMYNYHPSYSNCRSSSEQCMAFDAAVDIKSMEEAGQHKSISLGYTYLGWWYGGKWYTNDASAYPEGSMQMYLVKRNQDGSLDTTFGPNAGLSNDTYALGGVSFLTTLNNFESPSHMTIDKKGRILVIGTTTSNGTNKMFVARFTSNGVLDTTFGTKGIITISLGVDARGIDVAVDPFGRIVVAGYSHVDGTGITRNYNFMGGFSGQPYKFTVARLKDDGSLDTSFHDVGYLVDFSQAVGSDDYFVSGLVIHPTNGDYYVSGYRMYRGGLSGDYTMHAVIAKYLHLNEGACDTVFTFKDSATGLSLNDVSFIFNNVTYNSSTIPAIVNGKISFPMADGKYSYSVSSFGYDTSSGEYNVNGTSACGENVILLTKTPTCNAEFKFVNASDLTTPVYGVSFKFNTDPELTLKDTESSTIIPNLIRDSYPYTAKKITYNDTNAIYSVASDNTCSLEVVPLSLKLCPASFKVTIAGTSIGALRTVSTLLNGGVASNLVTNNSGILEIADLAPGTTYKILYTDNSTNAIYSYEGVFDLINGTCPATIDVPLSPAACNSTIKITQSGVSITDQSIKLTLKQGSTVVKEETTTVGSVSIPDLANGSYTCDVTDVGSPQKFNDSLGVTYTVNSSSCTKEIPLTKISCNATFIFNNSVTGSAVNDVSFTFNKVLYNKTTSPSITNGTITLADVISGTYYYDVVASGYVTQTKVEYVASGNTCKDKTVFLVPNKCSLNQWSVTGYEPGCVTCPAGSSSSSDSKSCVCPGVQSWNTTKNTCDCPTGTVWDEQSLSCKTPAVETLAFHTNTIYTKAKSITLDNDGNIYVAYGEPVDLSGTYAPDVTGVFEYDNNGSPIKLLGGTGDGIGEFNGPRGLAVDSNNYLYVSDSSNSRIQKFDPSGNFVTTWSITVDPSNPTASILNSGMALDDQNNLYVAVTGLRKFDATTGAPLGIFGQTDSGGQLTIPIAVAIDRSGQINVLDSWGPRIRIFSPSGILSSQVTTAIGTTGNFILGLAINKKTGDIFTSDSTNHAIRKQTSAYATPYLKKNSPTGMSSLAGGVNSPTALAVDYSTNCNGTYCVYVIDTGNNRVEVFDADLNFIKMFRIAGLRNLEFTNAQGITHDGSGNIYITDMTNSRIHKFDSLGNFITDFGWGKGSRVGQFNGPTDIAIDSVGNNYVADTSNHRIVKSNANGIYMSTFGTSSVFNTPTGIAIHGESNTDYIYVVDPGNNNVRKFKADDNSLVATWSGAISGPGGTATISTPTRILVASESDGSTYMYMNNTVEKSIQKFKVNTADNTLSFMFKISGFNNPAGMALDAQGTLYVANYDTNVTGNNSIVRFGSSKVQLAGACTNGACTVTTDKNGVYSFNSATQPYYVTLYGEYIYVTGSDRTVAVKISSMFPLTAN